MDILLIGFLGWIEVVLAICIVWDVLEITGDEHFSD